MQDEQIAALKELFQSEIRRVEAILSGQERAVTLLGNANRLAQDKFEASVAGRFIQVNEFRGSLADLGSQMATRRELETAITSMLDHYEDNRAAISDLRSRIDVGPAELGNLRSRVDVQSGRQIGSQATTANLYALALVIATVAGLLGHYIH